MKTQFFATKEDAESFANSLAGDYVLSYNKKENNFSVMFEGNVKNSVTFDRWQNGFFSVLCNNAKTEYEIINADCGCSGYQKNTYSILKAGKVVQTGLTLQKAKKTIIFILSKELSKK